MSKVTAERAERILEKMKRNRSSVQLGAGNVRNTNPLFGTGVGTRTLTSFCRTLSTRQS